MSSHPPRPRARRIRLSWSGVPRGAARPRSVASSSTTSHRPSLVSSTIVSSSDEASRRRRQRRRNGEVRRAAADSGVQAHTSVPGVVSGTSVTSEGGGRRKEARTVSKKQSVASNTWSEREHFSVHTNGERRKLSDPYTGALAMGAEYETGSQLNTGTEIVKQMGPTEGQAKERISGNPTPESSHIASDVDTERSRRGSSGLGAGGGVDNICQCRDCRSWRRLCAADARCQMSPEEIAARRNDVYHHSQPCRCTECLQGIYVRHQLLLWKKLGLMGAAGSRLDQLQPAAKSQGEVTRLKALVAKKKASRLERIDSALVSNPDLPVLSTSRKNGVSQAHKRRVGGTKAVETVKVTAQEATHSIQHNEASKSIPSKGRRKMKQSDVPAAEQSKTKVSLNRKFSLPDDHTVEAKEKKSRVRKVMSKSKKSLGKVWRTISFSRASATQGSEDEMSRVARKDTRAVTSQMEKSNGTLKRTFSEDSVFLPSTPVVKLKWLQRDVRLRTRSSAAASSTDDPSSVGAPVTLSLPARAVRRGRGSSASGSFSLSSDTSSTTGSMVSTFSPLTYFDKHPTSNSETQASVHNSHGRSSRRPLSDMEDYPFPAECDPSNQQAAAKPGRSGAVQSVPAVDYPTTSAVRGVCKDDHCFPERNISVDVSGQLAEAQCPASNTVSDLHHTPSLETFDRKLQFQNGTVVTSSKQTPEEQTSGAETSGDRTNYVQSAARDGAKGAQSTPEITQLAENSVGAGEPRNILIGRRGDNDVKCAEAGETLNSTPSTASSGISKPEGQKYQDGVSEPVQVSAGFERVAVDAQSANSRPRTESTKQQSHSFDSIHKQSSAKISLRRALSESCDTRESSRSLKDMNRSINDLLGTGTSATEPSPRDALSGGEPVRSISDVAEPEPQHSVPAMGVQVRSRSVGDVSVWTEPVGPPEMRRQRIRRHWQRYLEETMQQRQLQQAADGGNQAPQRLDTRRSPNSEGHHYGTPRPAADAAPRLSLSGDGGATSSRHPNSEGKRRRNRSTVEAMAAATNGEPSAQADPASSNQPQRAPEYRSVPQQYWSVDMNGSAGGGGDSDSQLGPLPEHWEKAFTEFGECYFIDHQSGTSHWLDPRLARVQKASLEECDENELPYGWERIDDATYGTYYIDHVNRRTQYENPVQEARRQQWVENGESIPPSSSSQHSGNNTFPRQKKSVQEMRPSGDPAPPAEITPPYGPPPRRGSNADGRPFFTRNPSELRGQMLRSTLYKSPQGLGFTIVGGDNDEVEEFLQIKSVVPHGPAWLDGQLRTGDVLVYVNGQCVLGYTHQDMVRMFQTIASGELVQVEVCRGYPLPFDPDDPNTEIVTTMAVSASDEPPFTRGYGGRPGSPHNSDHSITTSKSMPDLSGRDRTRNVPRPSSVDILSAEPLPATAPKPRFLTVPIVKGDAGFGFTIADSAHGQKVKKILDHARCTDLQEGDILVQIDRTHVKTMPHVQVVQVLKECAVDHEATVTVQRGGSYLGSERPPSRRPQSAVGLHRSHTPSADPYGDPSPRPSGGPPDGRDFPSPEDSPGYLPMQRLQQPDGRAYHPSFTDGEAYPVDTSAYRGDGAARPAALNHRPVYSYSQAQPYSAAAHSVYGGSAPPLLAGPGSHARRTYPPPLPVSNGDAAAASADGRPYWTQGGAQCDAWPPQNSDGQQYRVAEPAVDGNRAEPGPAGLPAGGGVSYNNYGPSTGDPHGRRDPGSRPFSYLRPNGGVFNAPKSLSAAGNSKPASDSYPSGDSRPALVQQQQQRKQSTSFEQELPLPSSVVRAARPPLQGVQYVETTVTLPRHDSGFGFRIVGGTEEKSQASIGHIVPGGAADLDGRLQSGDEIIHVDNQLVIGSSHHHVVQLMSQAGENGRVQLGIRRRVLPPARSPPGGPYPYEVVVTRRQGEGFGFVIISSAGRTGATIGRIMEGSPAERCGRLRVADRILAVNGTPIGGLHHDQVVALVKEGGYHVRLTVGPPTDDSSSTASTPQKDDDYFSPDGGQLEAIHFQRASRGFGFSIRGGREFHNMPLFVLRIAEHGPAAQDGRLRVGDQIIEINQTSTKGMTHGEAIELIKEGGSLVRLLVQRGARLPQTLTEQSAPSSLTSSSAGGTGRSSSALSQPYPVSSQAYLASHHGYHNSQQYPCPPQQYPAPPHHYSPPNHVYPPSLHPFSAPSQPHPASSSHLYPASSAQSYQAHPPLQPPQSHPSAASDQGRPLPNGHLPQHTAAPLGQSSPLSAEEVAYWRRQENI